MRQMQEEQKGENERKMKSTAVLAVEILDQRTVAVGGVFLSKTSSV